MTDKTSKRTKKPAPRAAEPLIELLAAVIADERPIPAYHRNRLARHRKEWPELWRAIDALLSAS